MNIVQMPSKNRVIADIFLERSQRNQDETRCRSKNTPTRVYAQIHRHTHHDSLPTMHTHLNQMQLYLPGQVPRPTFSAVELTQFAIKMCR